MEQTPYRTNGHSDRISTFIAKSHPGQAHWAGTGPDGAQCKTCAEFVLAKGKQCLGHCEKRMRMMTKAKKLLFDGDAGACRFYVEKIKLA
jgi:hypothetical protein